MLIFYQSSCSRIDLNPRLNFYSGVDNHTRAATSHFLFFPFSFFDETTLFFVCEDWIWIQILFVVVVIL